VETLAKRRLVMVTGRCHSGPRDGHREKLGVTLTEANLREFRDGEIHCRFDESIRGAHVFIVQTHATRKRPVNDAVMEASTPLKRPRRPKSITAGHPQLRYARRSV